MTASASAHPNRAGRKRRFGPLGWTLVIVAALIAAFVFATQVYTDWLWFSQLGFGGVFYDRDASEGWGVCGDCPFGGGAFVGFYVVCGEAC